MRLRRMPDIRFLLILDFQDFCINVMKYLDISGVHSAKNRHFRVLLCLYLPFLSSLFHHLALASPSLPSPSFQKLLLTDVELYLYTFAHLPLPEMSFSPVIWDSALAVTITPIRHDGTQELSAGSLSNTSIPLTYKPYTWFQLVRPPIYTVYILHIHDGCCFLYSFERFCCVQNAA